MTVEELEARGGASGLVRRLRLGSPLARVLLLGLPLAAMTSVLAGSGHAATWVVPSSSNAGNQAWLDDIVGPAPTVSAGETPGPAVAVLPSKGDPQVLVLPGPATSSGDSGGGGGAAPPPGPGPPAPAPPPGPPPVLPGPAPSPGDSGGRGASAPSAGPDTGALTSSGIPRRVLQAYVGAAQQSARIDPSCHITWPLLAGIGRVETDHGRFGGAHVLPDGLITPPIYGPRLDGTGGMPFIHA